MASRPVWEGHLRLSLVTCPVTLHKATQDSRGAIRFHLLNPETHNRVRQVWRDAVEDVEVARRDLVRGYEIEKDTYVVVEDEELDALKLESTKVIDIEKFVEARAIDRLYWDQPYYLIPDGKPAAEPYAVIREAMQKEGQVALGRLVMTSRERVVAIEVRARGMLLTTLRSRDEVREAGGLFDAIPDVKTSPQMIEIATKIISQAEGRFDPDDFADRYETALRELVERKAAGTRPVRRPEAPPEPSNVIDLMDALRRSLKGGAAARGSEGAAAAGGKPDAGERAKRRRGASPASPRVVGESKDARRSGGSHGGTARQARRG